MLTRIIHEDIKPKISSPTARRLETKLHRVLSEEHRVSEESTGYGGSKFPGSITDFRALRSPTRRNPIFTKGLFHS
jgi:hypothetical protein